MVEEEEPDEVEAADEADDDALASAVVAVELLKKSVKYCFWVLMVLMAVSIETNSFCNRVVSCEILFCRLEMLVPMAVDCAVKEASLVASTPLLPVTLFR